jgi:hypothetical protein
MRGVVGVESQNRCAPGKCSSSWQRERRLGKVSCRLRVAGNEVKGWCLARAVHPTNRGTPSLNGYLHERDLRRFQTLPLPKRVFRTCTTEIHRYASQHLTHKRHILRTAPTPQPGAAYLKLKINDSNARKGHVDQQPGPLLLGKARKSYGDFRRREP